MTRPTTSLRVPATPRRPWRPWSTWRC